MLFRSVSQYQLLPFVFHGDYSGAADDRMFYAGMSDTDRQMEAGDYGRAELPSVGASGNCVYLFLTEDGNERIYGADRCFLE